jgi:uncharacterized protein YndB with AHSA1/START domain
MNVQKSIDIAVPPQKIWPFLSEPDKILEWYIPLQKFEYTSEKHREVGATFYYEEKVPIGFVKLNCVVTEYEENKSFAFKMTSGNMMKSYEEKWVIEATPSGSRFTFSEKGELGLGIFEKFTELLAKRSSSANVEKILTKLKTLAES